MTFLKKFLTLSALKDAFLRFPLSVLSSALASGLAMFMAWNSWSYPNPLPSWAEPLFASSFLGILLFAGLALFAEGFRLRSWLVQVLIGVPALYFLAYQVDASFYDIAFLHYALIFLGSLALIFGGYYARKGSSQGLWNFGTRTWTRACVAIASALILILGFNLALVSVEQLFEISYSQPWYEYVIGFFGIFVANLIFLTGIPEDFKALEKTTPPEKGVRAFALFLSFPLLATYFVILAVYVVKILVTQDWPSGFVAMPVLLFSLIGFGTTVLVHPLRDGKSSSLVGAFVRFFPWTVLPFLAVYFVALWKRIEPYGLTEMRALGVLLGLVLVGWALYFGLKQKKANLRVIPLSLVVVSFLASVGPWSVFSVSEWHQVSRLEALLAENGILVEGKVQEGVEVPLEVNVEASEIVSYLENNHGFECLQKWFDEPVQDLTGNELMGLMGMDYSHSNPWGSGAIYSNFNVDGGEALAVDGYQYHFSFFDGADWTWDNTDIPAYEDGYQMVITLPNRSETLTVQTNFETQVLHFTSGASTLDLDLGTFIQDLKTKYPNGQDVLPRGEMSVTAENADLKVQVYFDYFNFSFDTELTSLQMDAQVFVTLKK